MIQYLEILLFPMKIYLNCIFKTKKNHAHKPTTECHQTSQLEEYNEPFHRTVTLKFIFLYRKSKYLLLQEQQNVEKVTARRDWEIGSHFKNATRIISFDMQHVL